VPRPKAPCGTYSAYKRHLREKTPVDDACAAARDARTEDAAQKRRAAKSEPRILSIVTAAPKSPPAPPADPDPDPEELTQVQILREGLAAVRAAITVVRSNDPARLAPLLKEQREIARELAQLGTAEGAKSESLASQLAAARAARQTGS